MIGKLLWGVGGLAVVAVALLLLARWWSGEDLLSGRDMQVAAARDQNPGLAIRRLAPSWGIHEVRDGASPLAGYMALPQTTRLVEGVVVIGYRDPARGD